MTFLFEVYRFERTVTIGNRKLYNVESHNISSTAAAASAMSLGFP
jgi:hypothetical protein